MLENVMSTHKKPPHIIVLIFLSCLSVMPINLFLPSLPNIAEEFRVDFALANLSIVVFAVTAAAAQLVAGPLSDWYGRRPVALAITIVFIVASIGSMMATTFEVFLIFRIVQAVVVAGYGISLAVINETTEGRAAASRIGYVAAAYAMVPMIGPTVGGSLDELFGWRASFLLFTVSGLLVLVLLFWALTETNHRRPQSLSQYITNYRRLVGTLRFWGFASCMAFSLGTLYVFLGAAPLVAGDLFNISAATLGLYMGAVPGGFMAGSFLSGRYAAKNSYSINVVIGRFVTFSGLLAGLTLAYMEVTHVLAFFGPCMFIGLGNGLTMPSANAGAIAVRPDLAGSAAGLASASSLAGGAVIAAVAGLFYGHANSVIHLFYIMLVVSALGLLAALYLVIADWRHAVNLP